MWSLDSAHDGQGISYVCIAALVIEKDLGQGLLSNFWCSPGDVSVDPGNLAPSSQRGSG